MLDRREIDYANHRKNFVESWIEQNGRRPESVMVVCPTCDGKGSHVNPSIDSNGLSPGDMDEDQWESYWHGAYDVTCTDCLGRNVVESFIGEVEDEWDSYMDKVYEDIAIRIAESGGFY